MTALALPARFLHIVEALLCAAVADLRIRRGFAAPFRRFYTVAAAMLFNASRVKTA